MKKKAMLAVVAIVLVCAITAVAGTIAYLKEVANNGAATVNTFVASDKLIDPPTESAPDNGFFITETDNSDSSKLTTSGNKYVVLPNVPIIKNARVKTVGKTDIASYVYVEVVDELDEKLTYSINADWKLLEGVTGANGGLVYVYKEVLTADTEGDGIQILADDTINVDAEYSAADGGKLSFFGYMCQQASFEPEDDSDASFVAAAAEAFEKAFPASSSSEETSSNS